MKTVIHLLAVMLIATQAGAAERRSVTFYTDGAVIEQEASARKGTIEITLPAGLIDGSLRIRPGKDTSIQRVDIVSGRTENGKAEKELESLLEQKNRLNDRLQALATREEIFTAAAKSQSGKAPRKTKANPDPLQTIRQGTEFAIAQLEAVYTARRKTEQEIRRIDSRIAAVKVSGRGAQSIARLHVSPARGTVMARFALAGQGWTPRYDMYLDDGNTAQLHLSGQFGGAFSGYLLQAAPSSLAEQSIARPFPVKPGPIARLASFHLPLTNGHFGTGIRNTFSCLLKNTEQLHLPGGDANLYKNGEYLGRFRFEGISSGRSKAISVGL